MLASARAVDSAEAFLALVRKRPYLAISLASAAAATTALLYLRRPPKPLWRTADERAALAAMDLEGDTLVKNGFTKNKADALGEIDTLIIGSGLSGLTVAAMLARKGQKVLVLEQHDQAGGNLHTFHETCEQGGKTFNFEFDTGVHYLGGHMGTKTSNMRKMFDYVTGGEVEWCRLDDIFDAAVCTGEHKTDAAETFDFHADYALSARWLKERFPKEQHAAIDAFFFRLKTTMVAIGSWFIYKLGGPRFLAAPYFREASKTTREVLMSMKGMTPKLMDVLTYSYGDQGLPPGKSSWVVQALITGHYDGGAFFPRGGPSRIAKAAVAVIKKFGGDVLVRAPVAEIIVDHNGACGVRLERGKVEIRAKRVVSSAGARNTYLKLVPSSHRSLLGPIVEALEKSGYAQEAGDKKGLQPSVCLACLFVGLDCSDEELGMPSRNFWRFPSWAHDSNLKAFMADQSQPFPAVFVSTSSSKDDDWKRRHPGVSTVQVLAPVNYQWFEGWDSTKLGKRGAEYNEFKRKLTDRLLEHLYSQLPQTRGHVVLTELGTPLTNNHFMAAWEGEVYGLTHSPERYTEWQAGLQPTTPIRNLYLTGQDIFCDGVGAALLAGVLTTVKISPGTAPTALGLVLP